MEIGSGLGFRVFIVTFRPGFDGLPFISLALAVAEAITDFDHSGSRSISLSNQTGHHEKNMKRAGDPQATQNARFPGAGGPNHNRQWAVCLSGFRPNSFGSFRI